MDAPVPGRSTSRAERPHTYLAQEPARCSGCGLDVLARVAERDGQSWEMVRCPRCGTRETLRDPDASSFVARLAERAAAEPAADGSRFLKRTTAACPECLALIPCDVVTVDGKVFFRKTCPSCGPSQALVSEDAGHYVRAYSFARAGSVPLELSTDAAKGCPDDCGLCEDHEQHTCLPIVEVTDVCDLECPICIANNRRSGHVSASTFAAIVDGLVRREGVCDSVALSGGEPAVHPEILDLLDIATRPDVGRVVLITNGLRLARDRAFAEAIKARGVYVGLQFDGFRPGTSVALRGRDLTAEKNAALDVLRELEIPTQLIVVAARGVNEDELGAVADLFLREPHVLSLNIQPAAFTGRGGASFAHDPLDRLTIPGIFRALEAQTGGRLRREDFYPLPCPHPQCVSLTYLLCLDDGRAIPFPRFADFERHSGLLRNSATLPATAETYEALHEIIHDVFARQDEIADGPAILAALRRSLDVMFPERPLTATESVRAGERQAKSIFVHHYMDRHDFDLERLRKCCHHYALPDGRIMPACGFNLRHRGAATADRA